MTDDDCGQVIIAVVVSSVRIKGLKQMLCQSLRACINTPSLGQTHEPFLPQHDAGRIHGFYESVGVYDHEVLRRQLDGELNVLRSLQNAQRQIRHRLSAIPNLLCSEVWAKVGCSRLQPTPPRFPLAIP